MISAFPTDPARLRALALAHTRAADILYSLANDLEPKKVSVISTDMCPASYEFRGDALPDIPPAPLTPSEMFERDLQRYREAAKRADRESRKC